MLVPRVHLIPYNWVLIHSADMWGGSNGCYSMDNSDQYFLACCSRQIWRRRMLPISFRNTENCNKGNGKYVCRRIESSHSISRRNHQLRCQNIAQTWNLYIWISTFVRLVPRYALSIYTDTNIFLHITVELSEGIGLHYLRRTQEVSLKCIVLYILWKWYLIRHYL